MNKDTETDSHYGKKTIALLAGVGGLLFSNGLAPKDLSKYYLALSVHI
jgi:hypothetical protein